MIFLASVFALLAPNAPGGFGPDVPEDPLDTDHPLDARLRAVFRSDAETRDAQRPVPVAMEDLERLVPGFVDALMCLSREGLDNRSTEISLTVNSPDGGTTITAGIFPFAGSWADPGIGIYFLTGARAAQRILMLYGRYFNAGTPEAFPAFHEIHYTGAWGKDGGKFLERCLATEESVKIALEAMVAIKTPIPQTAPPEPGPGRFLA